MTAKLFAKKTLGQNFLIQPQIIKEIVKASGASEGETVIEIGPGTGLLTQELLTTGAKIIAIEKDHRLIESLQKKFASFADSGTFKLIHGDILETNLKLEGKYRVVANIPYYITGKIIRTFLEREHKPDSMTLTMQKEVAERIVGRNPNTHRAQARQKESLLSVSVKAYGTPVYVRTVKAGNFTPVPKVDSAVLHISNISNTNFAHTSEAHFFDILHAGFASKRKKLSKNLNQYNKNNALVHAFETCAIEKGLRAEDLSVTDWFCIASKLR